MRSAGVALAASPLLARTAGNGLMLLLQFEPSLFAVDKTTVLLLLEGDCSDQSGQSQSVCDRGGSCRVLGISFSMHRSYSDAVMFRNGAPFFIVENLTVLDLNRARALRSVCLDR